MSTILQATIPGEPVAQGRGRAFRLPTGQIRVHDPVKSRAWKGVAQVHYQEALRAAALAAPAFLGPVEVHVLAVFTCPKGQYRKREPVARRPKATKPDAENVLKAVQDAGNGLLWVDDSQVARVTIEKFVGAQEEAPFVRVTVKALEPEQERFRMEPTQAGA
jgi:Holliday junction resolvase RusA-like endonuclease